MTTEAQRLLGNKKLPVAFIWEHYSRNREGIIYKQEMFALTLRN